MSNPDVPSSIPWNPPTLPSEYFWISYPWYCWSSGSSDHLLATHPHLSLAPSFRLSTRGGWMGAFILSLSVSFSNPGTSFRVPSHIDPGDQGGSAGVWAASMAFYSQRMLTTSDHRIEAFGYPWNREVDLNRILKRWRFFSIRLIRTNPDLVWHFPDEE